MKSISINAQKKMMYIPFVNILVLHIWLYNYTISKKPWAVFCKSLLIILGYSLPIAGIIMFLSAAFPSLEKILVLGGAYCIPLAYSYGLIEYQESL